MLDRGGFLSRDRSQLQPQPQQNPLPALPDPTSTSTSASTSTQPRANWPSDVPVAPLVDAKIWELHLVDGHRSTLALAVARRDGSRRARRGSGRRRSHCQRRYTNHNRGRFPMKCDQNKPDCDLKDLIEFALQ